MKEWKTIPEYPMYEASSDGEIRNRKTGRILKTHVDTHGYYQLTVRKNKQQIPVKVHRLVAEAFYPDADRSLDVNHIDGDKLNNTSENLEFCTRQENIIHAFKMGLRVPRSMQPVEVVETGEIFPSIRECSRQTGLDQSAIVRCLKNKQGSHAGYHFKKVKK